jgi:hypothetical protein
MANAKEMYVIMETHRLLKVAFDTYGIRNKSVTVDFYDVGSAHALTKRNKKGEYQILYSRESIETTEVDDSIAHEVAHVVCLCLYNSVAHDKLWKKICVMLGGTGEVKGATVMTPKRMHTYFKYELPSGKIIWLASMRHKRIQSGYYYKVPDTGETITESHFMNITGTKLDAALTLNN